MELEVGCQKPARLANAGNARVGGLVILPRLLRLRDAPRYLGMDKNRFNREVRPCVPVIRIGIQGIAFDRLDLDAWVDKYKSRIGPSRAEPSRAKPTGQKKPAGLTKRGAVWHIDKDIFGERICESTRTGDLREAVDILSRRIDEARQRRYFGIVPRKERTFREAARKFLEENRHKRSLDRDTRTVAAMDRYIGDLPVRRVHHGTLQPYVKGRLAAGKAAATVNRDLALVRRVLNLCARLWRDEDDRPWLDTAPLIQMQREVAKRGPYPLSFEEERLLFSELAAHLARMALFKVITGTREHEVISLRWDWEVHVPELETSVFVVPRIHVKNGMQRVVVLNRIARSVVESCRGEHRELVFTHEGHGYTNINNSGWQGARRRAAARYEQELGRPCPDGFRNVRVHDLKHTYGYRLRAAGVQFEDRQLLLGHKAPHITTHYSAADVGNLLRASEGVCDLPGRGSLALAILRT